MGSSRELDLQPYEMPEKAKKRMGVANSMPRLPDPRSRLSPHPSTLTLTFQDDGVRKAKESLEEVLDTFVEG